MSNLVLIDSSAFIALLRKRTHPFELLDEYVPDYDFALCGIVWMEVLRGLRSPSVRDFFAERFSTMTFLELSKRGWARAAHLAWEMDRRGTPLPLTDLAIAVCAMEHDAALLSFDRHFERIEGLVLTSELL